MKEKRRYMRFNTLMEAICHAGGARKKLKVSNVSKEGVGILGEEDLVEGEDLEIEMMIPGDNIPVIFEGKVAWTSDDRSGGKHKGGVKFKKISNHDKSRVLEYIYQNWIKPARRGKKKSKTEER